MVLVDDLRLDFRILEDRASSIKEVASRFRIARAKRTFSALRGVSLEVSPSETLGLIGHNGSGKSTLLKCIAGILPPTSGKVLVGGTVASLIELGAGFHPELTGRENVMLNGAMFGLTRKQIRTKFDSVVAFAEVERVIDQPIRAYSSGMYVRLAFSLAIHVEPKILLIDEVLAVGDESFQRKCVGKVKELRGNGVTILFVSHDMGLVNEVCQRSILLSEGTIAADGETSAVVERYLEAEHAGE